MSFARATRLGSDPLRLQPPYGTMVIAVNQSYGRDNRYKP